MFVADVTRYIHFVSYCFFFKQKTAYEMRISDWSSDVCSSDLSRQCDRGHGRTEPDRRRSAGRGIAVPAARQLAGGHHRGARHSLLVLDDGDGDERVSRPRQSDEPWFAGQIGRASCRESVCQYVSISVVAVSLKKKHSQR